MDEYGGPAAPPRPPKPAARVHRAGAAGARPPGVSLLRPRPEAERERNAYVEAPRRPGCAAPAGGAPHKPVTVQPGAATGAADKRRVAAAESIVCAACGRCRCSACTRPRPLPQRWVGGSCLCSAEACVDYLSCMCCAKALFYHCGGGEEAGAAGAPCACGPRLACVAALAVPLPCLLLYWPLRAAAALGAAAYGRLGRTGCRCAAPPLSSII